MLEGLAAWVLNTYVGEYLENLNTEQLSIGLLQGQVQLENVPLKTSALRKFDLPIAIKTGVLGKLTLSIPVTHLRSEPWVIVISDLYIVLEPCQHRTDIEFDEQYQQSRKRQQLEALETAHRKQLDQPGATESGDGSWFMYGASLVSTIVDNIQLIIHNVNICYEDSTSYPGKSFGFGIKIDKVSVQSTDAKWRSGFVTPGDPDESLFKSLELTGLSVYWLNEGEADSPNASSSADSTASSSQCKRSTDHTEYVLRPVNASVRLERQRSKLPLRSNPPIPRFRFEVTLNDLQVTLNKTQLICQTHLTSEWRRFDRSREFRKWRPREKLAENAAVWWRFAINSHLESIRRTYERKSLKYIVKRAQHNKVYVDAYKRKLSGKAFSKADEALIKQIENEYSYEDLQLLREVALVKIKIKPLLVSEANSSIVSPSNSSAAVNTVVATPEEPQPGFLSSWMTSWYYGGAPVLPPPGSEPPSTSSAIDSYVIVNGSDSTTSTVEIKELKEVSEKLESEILEVIHDSVDDSTFLRRDTVFTRLSFHISSIVVEFMDDLKNINVLSSSLGISSGKIDLSPRHHSTMIHATVGTLNLKSDFFKSTTFPDLLWMEVVDPAASSSPTTPLLKFSYERRAPKLTAHHDVSVQMSPLHLLYHGQGWQKLTEYFDEALPTQTQDFEYLISDVEETDLKHRINDLFDQQDSLKDTLSQINVALDIAAPKIHIPDSLAKPRMKVIIDFGRFLFHTANNSCASPDNLASPSDTFGVVEKTGAEELALKISKTAIKTTFSDDDLFVTPPSSPVDVESGSSLSQSNFENCLYHSYFLELKDMQVLLCEDARKQPVVQTLSGSRRPELVSDSIIQKFSISFLCMIEKVSLSSSDLPGIKISGRVPEMRFHLNESKLKAFSQCFDVIFVGQPHSRPLDSELNLSRTAAVSRTTTRGSRVRTLTADTHSLTTSDSLFNSPKPLRKVKAAIQFAVDRFIIELQGSDIAIGELQICNLAVEHQELEFDRGVSVFTLQSLLLVDAMQTYGPDFELILASHRGLGLDTQSGALKADVNSMSNNHGPKPLAKLIFERNSIDQHNKVNLKFSSLDLSVNQKTLVAMVDFFHSIHLSTLHNRMASQDSMGIDKNDVKLIVNKPTDTISGWNVEVWFGSLSMLFAREHSPFEAQKVAIMTLHGFQLQLHDLNLLQSTASGSLDGLQIKHLSGNGRRIMDFGFDVVEDSFKSLSRNKARSVARELRKRQLAFDFEYSWINAEDTVDNRRSDLKLNIASVYYTHSQLFIDELTNCYDIIYNKFESLGNSVKMSASLIASEFMEKKSVSSASKNRTKLDIVLRSPVITFITGQMSDVNLKTEYLVLHLGNLHVNSCDQVKEFSYLVPTDATEKTTYRCQLTNASAYSALESEGSIQSPRDWDGTSPASTASDKLHPVSYVLNDLSLDFDVTSGLAASTTPSLIDIFDQELPRHSMEQKRCLCICTEIHSQNKIKIALTSAQFEQLMLVIDLFGGKKTQADKKDVSDESELMFLLDFVSNDLVIDLVGEMLDGKAFLGVECHKFGLKFRKTEPKISRANITLEYVFIRDYLEGKLSTFQHLLACSDHSSSLKLDKTYLSNSCPDIATPCDDDISVVPSSLPSTLTPDVAHKPLLPPSRSSKPTSSRVSRRSSINEEPAIQLSLIFIDPAHSLFATKYKQIGSHVYVNASCVDFVFHQQTLVSLIDFFNGSGTGVPSAKYVVVSAKEYRISLDKPADDYTLAMITGRELTVTVGLLLDRMVIDGHLTSATMHDCTPLFSTLYDEKLSFDKHLVGPDQKVLAFSCVKYRDPDYELKRLCDVDVELVPAPGLMYVHSQRFIMEIVTFFMHFVQLQDLVDRWKAVIQGRKILESPPRGSRVKIKVNTENVKIALPISSLNDRMLVASGSNLFLDNAFVFSSQKLSTFRQLPDDEFDCLLDVLNIQFKDVQFTLCDRFTVTNRRKSVNVGETVMQFQNYTCNVSQKTIHSEALFNAPANLGILVERNLDTATSHSVPDNSIIVTVDSLNCNITVEEFQLIRGVLDHNLGEEIPVFQLPPEFRANLASVAALNGTPSCSLRFALEMTAVVLNCYKLRVSKELIQLDDEPSKFCRVDFRQAKLLFEAFSDSSKDLDLTMQEAYLFDTRFADEPVNKRPCVFPEIFRPRNDFRRGPGHLLAEVHLHTSRDRNRLTVLFSNAHLLWLEDFVKEAQLFVTAEPLPKSSQMTSRTHSTPSMKTERSLSSISVSPGIATKMAVNPFSLPIQQSDGNTVCFEFKLNSISTDILLMENPSSLSSGALLIKATFVFQLRQLPFHLPTLSCTVQALCVDSCSMRSFQSTDPDTKEKKVVPLSGRAKLVDTMSASIELKPHNRSRLPAAALSAVQAKRGKNSAAGAALGLLELTPSESHHLEISFNDVAITVGFHDYILLNGIMENLMNSSTSDADNLASITESRAEARETVLSFLSQVEARCDSFAVCLIDDLNQTHCMPLTTMELHNVQVDAEVKEDYYTVDIETTLLIDYFNKNISANEPLLEPWKFKVNSNYTTKSAILTTELISEEIVNFSLTVPCIQQLNQLKCCWIDRALNVNNELEDTSSLVLHTRNEYIPYFLVNDCGTDLKFATKNDSSAIGRRELSWRSVVDGASVPFSFEISKSSRQRSSTSRVSNNVIIQLNGATATSPIAADCVGTYFRIVRFNVNQPSSSLAGSQPYARIVIDITLDEQSRKVIRIRSGLTLVNCLDIEMEVKLENTASFLGDIFFLTVSPHIVKPVPIRYVCSKVYVRPKNAGLDYFRRPIVWEAVRSKGASENYFRDCLPLKKGPETFRMCLRLTREHYPDYEMDRTLPGHTIAFVPPLIVLNLLSVELFFMVRSGHQVQKRVAAGKLLALCSVDLTAAIELRFSTESLQSSRSLVINISSPPEMFGNMILFDSESRPFLLQYRVVLVRGGARKITLSSPYLIINKFGLPLVIKQEGVTSEAAGQMEENETARHLTPLMFSFADTDAPKQCQVRLGKQLHSNHSARWCRRFVLEPGITFRKLTCRPRLDNSPDLVYIMGIEVRKGTGAYQDTTFVILTPCFQLRNKSRYCLQISQKYDVELNPEGQYKISANSSLAWHWLRQDRELLLRVKREGLLHWTQGFRIDQISSFHLNIRDEHGIPQFLRVEIVLHGALHYVTFSDADNLPPPMRLFNRSDVPVLYQQQGVEPPHLRTILRPQTSVDYAWDDYMQEARLVLTVFGSKSGVYDVSKPGEHEPLIYENNFFITMLATINGLSRSMDHELVLTALPKGKIVLGRKEINKATQLWRMTAEGHLENVGFSTVNGESFVLDIKSHGEPTQVESLMLKKADVRRKLTQKWTFTQDSRLRCGYHGLYVQAFEHQLRDGTSVVLGPITPTTPLVNGRIPVDQWIEKQRSRPGSGFLGITVYTDGPTKVLEVADRQQQKSVKNSKASATSSNQIRKTDSFDSSKWNIELLVSVALQAGLGISIINTAQEELLYCHFAGTVLSYMKPRHFNKHSVTLRIIQIQVDNQLQSANRWQFLYIKAREDAEHGLVPALNLNVQWSFGESYDMFDCLDVQISKIVLEIDEVLLWKLVMFANCDTSPNKLEIQSNQLNVELEEPPGADARRCYFGILKISVRRLYLSVNTAPVLPNDLKLIRQALNIRLVRFENAPVELLPLEQRHFFGTFRFLFEQAHLFYGQQLRSQAVKILGTVDFLGNPLGLFNDLTSGISELLTEGNVGGLVAGIAHGFSNSAAKFTSSLSSGVGKISMDENHQELRERYRQHHGQAGSPIDHLMSGVKGLGIGILGGTTSIIQQTYDGAVQQGLSGFVSGLGKGVVGTVTRPIQGLLDFTSGVATATKEVVASAGPTKSRFAETRLRYPRVIVGLQGTLPPFSPTLAAGQQILLGLNSNNLREICFAVEPLKVRDETEPLFALVSSDAVYFIRRGDNEHRLILRASFGMLADCSPSQSSDLQLIDLYLKTKSDDEAKRKSIVCDDVESSLKLCEEIKGAKNKYDDAKRCLTSPEDHSVII